MTDKPSTDRPFAIVLYKPSSNDYCRGCLMASYSSNFELAAGLSQEEVVNMLREVGSRNAKLSAGESTTGVAILYDGSLIDHVDIDECDDKWLNRCDGADDDFRVLCDSVRAELDAPKIIRDAFLAEQDRLQQAEAREKQATKKAKDNAERAQYEKLKKKFDSDLK